MPEKVVRKNEKYEMTIRFLCDELNLVESELNLLRKKISEVKGHVRVIMHPYGMGKEFTFKYLRLVVAQHLDSINKYEGSSRNSPSFIFVEDFLMEEYKEFLEKVTGVNLTKLGIILIPTFFDEGRPSDGFLEIGDKFDQKYFGKLIDNHINDNKKEDKDRVRSFYYLVRVFKMLGIKSIHASGGFIGAAPFKDAEMARCLGTLIEYMRRGGFKIDISKHVKYKDGLSRVMLKDVGVPVKETGVKKN